jgi:asparagine synthase (glutamine-hydrolysing)
MCGIAGFLSPGGFPDAAAAERLVAAMSQRIFHRGPDDGGTWLDREAGLAFGFRRLSIIDLSEAGHQPMLSACGRYAIVFNGEIYNFQDMRAEIEAVRGGHAWRGHSDTEVLLEAVAEFGFEAAIGRTNGMFGLALWDRRDRVLWLARDRIGKKPVHYGWIGGSFAFASELKALRAHPQFDPRVSTAALGGFLQLGYVLGAQTIHAGLHKLPAGQILRLDSATAARRETPTPRPYWSLREAALKGLDAQAGGRSATVEELEALLEDAVARRMVADVPVGAFLSGGIDSSLTTALMAVQAPGKVRSFSIGFPAREWDEAGHAKAVADHIGTSHAVQYVTPAETLAMVAEVPGICDEPFADDSIIPTTLLCRMARREVTVAISGDGGDELFGGYPRYWAAEKWLARRAALPAPLRALAGGLVANVAQPAAARWLSQKFERRLGLLARLLGDGDPESFGETIMSQTLEPARLLADPTAFRRQLVGDDYRLGRSNAIDRLTYMDSMSFLIDDILAKVDRASMSTSLEVRCPILDWRVIEMSWRFPSTAKTDGGRGKLPLREILYKHVPRAIVDRPKMGFSAPVELWVKDDLRDWGEALMSRDALARHGLLDVAACRRLWEGYVQQGRGWDRMIWNLLMFQAWHAATLGAAPARPALAA